MVNLQVSFLFSLLNFLAKEIIGFHATTATEFAEAFEQALALEYKLAMRLRARESAKRFTEEEFAKRWIVQMEKLVILRQKKQLAPGAK
jgi:alpha-1,2-mannosyltransferase